MSRRRVVITGIGVVCPLGVDRERVFDALIAGRSGIDRIRGFDASHLDIRFGGEVRDFDPERWIERREVRRLDRFCHFAIAAGDMALEDAGLEPERMDPERSGIILASGIGGILEFEEQHERYLKAGPSRVSPFFVPKMMLNAAAGVLAMRYRLCGINYGIASACASANHALGAALRAIQYGDADLVIAGGSEAALTPMSLSGFHAAKALSKRGDDPQAASRPFDKDRDGFVLSEGCGVLIFEELEAAKRRGAKIYAEVLGFGASADAYHITQPHPEGKGAAAAMRLAVRDAGVRPEQVTYINAHGTSTPFNDAVETLSIKKVFGDHARKIAISSTKSMIGHLLGASGGVEAAATAMSILRGVVHPTINYETPDPDCDLDYVPNEARELAIDVALSNSLGFGGHNATIALGKVR